MSFVVAVILSGASVVEAQAQTEPCRPGQPSDRCCTPGPSGNVADEEEGLDPDCPTGDDAPGGRSHRRGDDAVADDHDLDDHHLDDHDLHDHDLDNDTGSSDGDFRPGRRFGRGSGGGKSPAGSAGPGPSGDGEGESPAGRIGAGPESGGPGGGTTGVGAPGGGTSGGPPAARGPVARSSPGVRTPSGGPSPTSASVGSASKGAGGAGQGAGTQVGGSIARTGPDIGIPLGLAMTLLLVGTSLLRTNRPLSRTPRRGHRAPSPEPASPGWTYVDHSSSARAIEKF